MSFDAGAVTSSLRFDTSEFEHGMLAVGAALQLFPPQLVELMENPMLGTVAIIKEATEKAAEFIKDMFQEVQNDAHNTGLAAEKAGVSPEFLSGWTEVGKTVNVSQEQISTGFKFLQKNAVDAADGNAQAMKSFTDLGISQEFVQTHLSDTEVLFEAVHEAINKLPTAAERSRRSMEVMGRSGADLAPIFRRSSDEIKRIIDVAQEFGALETGKSVEEAQKTADALLEVDEAWRGLKKDFADPVLESFNDHWKELEPELKAVAQALKEGVPAAIELTKDALIIAIPLVEAFLLAIEPLAGLSDLLHITHGSQTAVDKAGDALEKVEVSLRNINFNVDTNKASTQVGEAIKPHIDEGFNRFQRGMTSHSSRQKAANALRARH
jgi:hypothetical protein